MIIDGMMQVGISPPGFRPGLVQHVSSTPGRPVLGRTALMNAPSTAIRDLAQLLDVDMDQITGCVAFVAHCRLPAHRQSGGLVDALKLRHPVAGQDPTDGGSGDSQVVSDAVGSPLAGEPKFDDPAFASHGKPVRTGGRSAGVVVEVLGGAGACDPAVYGCRRDLVALGDLALA